MKPGVKTSTRAWILLSLAFTVVATFPVRIDASPVAQPGYIVLGDSIDSGVGDTDSTNGVGYVSPFLDYLQQFLDTDVDLHNLSEPGAESLDILLTQLAPATAEIKNHQPYGVVVSWGGGGNDLRHFIASPEAATCLRIRSCLARLNALLAEVEQHADVTLRTLRSVAGSEAVVLVRTEYNPLLKAGCDPDGRAALGNAALEGAPGTLLTRGLNDRLRALADKYGAKVVEIFEAFALYPDALISADCIHPNDAGYQVILAEFISAFPAP